MTAITASPVSINFHGTTIPTFNVEGVIRVAMKTICQSIGLDWRGQRQRILRHPVLSKGVVMITTPSKGGIQKSLTLPLNKLNGWLFGVDATRVKPEAREKLVEYQEECFEVLSDYWQKGEAVNQRQGTLSGTTIGTDGFRCLAAVVNGKLKRLPAAVRRSAKSHLWQQVHKAFSVISAEDIPLDQMDSARNFVAAYVIEGDYLAKQVAEKPPRQIRTRDDLSFTQRNERGCLINWNPPGRGGNWHECVGIGSEWFSEIEILAKHSPQAAYDALVCSSVEAMRVWNDGHQSGFFERMASHALASMLDCETKNLPIKRESLGKPPAEGFDYYLSGGNGYLPRARA